MEFLVVYFSRGGKTGKIAEAIADELGCKSVDIKKERPDLSEADMLIVGSGNYGGKPGKELEEFLDKLQPVNNRKAAIFVTSGGPEPKSLEIIQKFLETKGYKVISNFDCRGRMLLLNRGHPNEDDLKRARVFASDLKKTLTN
jgi:flavodoxin